MLARALLAAGCLATAATAQTPGSIVEVGDTLVSAMMMFLGNEEKVYILDKAEMNPTEVAGHPAWGAVWDIATKKAMPMDVDSNTFCASGIHLANGSYATFGGNHAVSPGPHDWKGPAGTVDPTLQDEDGRKSIRILNPCTGNNQDFADTCQWYDDASVLAMQKARWYSTAEALGDGTAVLIGGMVNGGFINRKTPVTDPITQTGSAENTYEFYPRRANFTPPVLQFLVDAGGLNTYTHAFLMASGQMFLQANLSSTLWDPDTNKETPLPTMPNNVVRVYPASGATAMLPLTPDNNYTPTILFCGGFSGMDDATWGNYGGPNLDPWTIPSSADCRRITPEADEPAYEKDDDLPIPRTMGQFIILPDETMLVVNGGAKGTAAYANGTVNTPFDQMPFGWSLSTDPVLTPVLYNPTAAAGSRWSSAGFQASKIPRLYHSSAILLPDASVLIAGSNPNGDYSPDAPYPTEYRAEQFYPSYFGQPRPQVDGIPASVSYGGPYFNLTVTGVNATAEAPRVVLVRGGFTTHGMNMGQRLLRLNSTYTQEADGSMTLHVAQAPPNANLLTPGPALLFVVVGGVPSIGKMVIVGNGVTGKQPIRAVVALPASSVAPGAAAAAAATAASGMTTRTYIYLAASVAAGAILLAALVWCLCRRKKSVTKTPPMMYKQTGSGSTLSVSKPYPYPESAYSYAASVEQHYPSYPEPAQTPMHHGTQMHPYGRGV